MSDNWVVQNLENALDTWNEKLAEIWQLITQSPETFKGGAIWKVIVDIHGALQAIGLALLVLFFVVGVMRTCGDFASVKKPEHALKLFIRFALAKGAVTYGLELMMALFKIVQGVISAIMKAAGFGSAQKTVLPTEIVTAVEDCGFFESIPLWAVTLIGGLFITVLSFIMIMSVYGRFFKLYLYTAIAPCRCPRLRESRARAWERASSRATPPCALRGQSLCLPASSSRCLRRPRPQSTPMRRRSRWCGAISGNWCSICSSLSVRLRWQTVSCVR